MARVTSSIVTPANPALQFPQIQAVDQPLHKNPTPINTNNKETEEPRTTATEPPNNSGCQFTRAPIGIIFYLHFLAVLVLAVILTIRGFLSSHARRNFQPLEWYPPMLTSVGLAGISGLAWQTLTHYYPSKAIRLAFWFSPLLTLAMGVLLIAIGSALSLAFGVISIVVAVVQSLYACWVSQRFDHAVAVVAVSTAFPPPKTMVLTVVVVVLTVGYCGVLMGGVGGATAVGTQVDKLLIAVLVLSMAWTMQVIKNLIQVGVSTVKYLNFSCGDESDICRSLRASACRLVGPICSGSILVPLISLVRGSARGVSLIAGDSDEFLFSCTDCYSGIASRLVMCANRWGFVHVGVYEKGILRSSSDTWEMFQRAGMEQLIDFDLTSSFCFLCGLSGGALSCLTGGIWSLIVHKEYATEISAYGFLIGYFLSRIGMAWPQACVSAYHVAFAENPQSARFDATIPVRLQELQKYQV